MNKERSVQIGAAGLLAIAVIFGLSAFIESDRDYQDVQNEENRQTINISLTIENVYTNKQVSAVLGDTALEVLQSLDKEDPKLLLVTKEYPGLGILVESMRGKMNGTNDEYWQYFVNGVMPQIGADKLELNEGDSVAWRFEKSEF